MEDKSALKRLGKSGISVTDIASQFWCEKQMELNYLYGKRYTEAMRRGKQLHADLQAEVFVPLSVEPVTYADFVYKTGYENCMALKTLADKGVCRELHIYGSLNGYRISGQIDELKLESGKVRIIELKTVHQDGQAMRIDSVYARPHIVQVMLYKRLLEDLKQGVYTISNFTYAYKIKSLRLSDAFLRGLRAIGVKEEFASIEGVYEQMFKELNSLPEISSKLEIVYMDRFTGNVTGSIVINYDEEKISKDIAFALHYWNGDRQALPVSKEEAWKCNLCKFFGKECTVWWKK
ncbi:MAG: PD-(D/E)XK nuclease family protein [Candidatus Micrarchaeaceae archaeon]